MARSGIGVLICSSLFAVYCGATEPEMGRERLDVPKGDHKKAGEGDRKAEKRLEMDEEEAKSFQKMLERIPPDRRERFLRNFEAWIKLPNSERDFLRQREEVRRKERRRQAENAMREAGLALQGERKMKFLERFGQERRRIEETLRVEMEEKRRAMIQESLAQLKEEFSQDAPGEVAPETAPDNVPGNGEQSAER